MAVITSLVSYWSLDEASGNAVDAHGANTLTDTNTVGATTGKVAGCRDFEASSTEYFTKADNADLSTGDIDFSIQAWVNAESLSLNVILAKWGNSNNEYLLYYDGSRITFGVSSNGSNQTDVQSNNFGAPTTSTWYCVHAWHDATNNEIGIAVNTTTNTSSYSSGGFDGSNGFYLGSLTGAGLEWDGLIDEVGFWKKVLTSGERTWLYNSGNGRSYTDIVNEAGAGAKAKVMFGRALRFFTRRY